MVVMMCMSCGMVIRITVTCYLVKICPHQWEFLLLRNISYSSAHCQKRVILHCSYFVILIFILRGLCAFTIESMSLQRHFNLVSNCAVGESWWDKDSTLVYTPQILFLFLRKPFTCLDLLKNFRWLFFDSWYNTGVFQYLCQIVHVVMPCSDAVGEGRRDGKRAAHESCRWEYSYDAAMQNPTTVKATVCSCFYLAVSISRWLCSQAPTHHQVVSLGVSEVEWLPISNRWRLVQMFTLALHCFIPQRNRVEDSVTCSNVVVSCNINSIISLKVTKLKHDLSN